MYFAVAILTLGIALWLLAQWLAQGRLRLQWRAMLQGGLWLGVALLMATAAKDLLTSAAPAREAPAGEKVAAPAIEDTPVDDVENCELPETATAARAQLRGAGKGLPR